MTNADTPEFPLLQGSICTFSKGVAVSNFEPGLCVLRQHSHNVLKELCVYIDAHPHAMPGPVASGLELDPVFALD